MSDRIEALRAWLEEGDSNFLILAENRTQEEATVLQNGEQFRYGVLTEDEADDMQIESIQNYIDENVYERICPFLTTFFDESACEKELLKEPRGKHTAPYDGIENEFEFEGENYIIVKLVRY